MASPAASKKSESTATTLNSADHPASTRAPSTRARRKILVTAALPYANGEIHIGHLVEYLQADFWTRFQKMRGHDCLYFCADDTHGTPILVKARELGISPETLIARSHEAHLRDFAAFGIGFDTYSSTHSGENRQLSEYFYSKMKERGHTEIRSIEQLYCDHDKMFLPDRFVKGTCPQCGAPDQYGDSCDKCGSTYSPTELKNPACSICGTPPVKRASDHVFFKLKNFRTFLQEWVPQHTSKEIANKLKEWLDADLRDWDISRDEPYFGFPIPGLVGKYFYVWLDAPVGYISATQQWCTAHGRELSSVWPHPHISKYSQLNPTASAIATGNTEAIEPAGDSSGDGTEIYHFIGKDIVYFHCLFWPAMLACADFALPSEIYVHGFLTVNGEKMSKSKGTSITARTYLKHLDPMYLRYYYACKLTASLHDLDLNTEDFVNRVNSDLIGKITNLGSRGAQMLNKRFEGRLGRLPDQGRELVKMAQDRCEVIAQYYEKREFSKGISEIREIADHANKYFDEKAPWVLIKEDAAAAHEVLTTTVHLFRILAIALKPVLPQYADKVATLLGEESYVWSDLERTLEQRSIGPYTHLATRVESEKWERIIEESKQ